MKVQASWADSIEPGDFGSAARLWLMARREGSRSTIVRLEERFPNLRTYAATATAEGLGIVGDPELRREHRDLRQGEGHTTESAREERQRRADEGPSSGPIPLRRVIRRIARLLLFPWPQLIDLARRSRAASEDPDACPF